MGKKQTDIALHFVGYNWLAESKTSESEKFLSKVRFAYQDKRFTNLYSIPNNKIRTFMTLAEHHSMNVVTR